MEKSSELNQQEAVPVQQGEVPEELMSWIKKMVDEKLPGPGSGKELDVRYGLKTGAIAMYHRDQEQIKGLQSEIVDYHNALEEIRACYPAPIALAKVILDKYNLADK